MIEVGTSPAARPLTRWERQRTLFARRPSRLSLQELGSDAPAFAERVVRVNVHRNHALEPVAALTAPYAEFGNYRLEFALGPYDDALTFTDLSEADVELLWLDAGRYQQSLTAGDLLRWLHGRVAALRELTAAPILVALLPGRPAEVERMVESFAPLVATFGMDLGAVAAEHDVDLLSERTAAIAGTRLAPPAHGIVARELAGRWIPAAALPPIKAIALDLDNTLHAGVLAEDGVERVVLTESHRRLQSWLKGIAAKGVYLALISRNEADDVRELFDRRADYPLRWQDFAAFEVSWRDKATAFADAAATLRIAPDAMLFVDDNPGELASFSHAWPDVGTVYAAPDADETLRAIEYFPGVWRWRTAAEDALRTRDLLANTERDALRHSGRAPDDYLRELDVRLQFSVNDPLDRPRAAELCRKTNQFNLTLARSTEGDLLRLSESGRATVVTVRLSDRLADSGLIAVVVTLLRDAELVVKELCISCRALGRGLETTIAAVALGQALRDTGAGLVAFDYARGPRNAPALSWLQALASEPLGEAGTVSVHPLQLTVPQAAAGISITGERHV